MCRLNALVAVKRAGSGHLGSTFSALDLVVHLLVVIDRNELQSDKPTEEILALGDLESKLRSFGWHVASCDGHDHSALRAVFDEFSGLDDRPQALVAHTIKGKGVSFMEHSA